MNRSLFRLGLCAVLALIAFASGTPVLRSGRRNRHAQWYGDRSVRSGSPGGDDQCEAPCHWRRHHLGHKQSGRVHDCGPGRRPVRNLFVARGLQDRGDQKPQSDIRAADRRQADAGSRRGERARDRRLDVRDHPDAVDHDFEHDQDEPDHQAAADQPQRDGLRQLPAGRVDAGRQPRRDDQRPAAGRHQHHARRHQHPGQHDPIDRRLLRDRQPASRRDRRSLGHDRRPGRRRRARARCRSSS